MLIHYCQTHINPLNDPLQDFARQYAEEKPILSYYLVLLVWSLLRYFCRPKILKSPFSTHYRQDNPIRMDISGKAYF